MEIVDECTKYEKTTSPYPSEGGEYKGLPLGKLGRAKGNSAKNIENE
ncbi:hypothetical protein [Dysgonomonas sp. 25]|nr:hypothetical protein [Dysgonomonas sp. 25]